MRLKEDIKETEIRVIGSDKKKQHSWLLWLFGALAAVAVGALCLWRFLQPLPATDEESGVFETPIETADKPDPLNSWFSEQDTITDACIVSKDSIVNDISVTIILPINSTPHLEIGYHCMKDTIRNLMFLQAADIRADNKKIVGAFVLQGKPLSWGLNKKGYCSIIDGKVTIGVADNSPLFEEATEKNGDFFRQYALVDNGVLVENYQQKNRYIRRSICDIGGHIVVVVSHEPVSMHDFAQLLVDLGADNAISLVGSSEATTWRRDISGKTTATGFNGKEIYKYISFIVWQKE